MLLTLTIRNGRWFKSNKDMAGFLLKNSKFTVQTLSETIHVFFLFFCFFKQNVAVQKHCEVVLSAFMQFVNVARINFLISALISLGDPSGLYFTLARKWARCLDSYLETRPNLMTRKKKHVLKGLCHAIFSDSVAHKLVLK